MSRRNQHFDLSKFAVGKKCGKKNEIADLADVPRQSNFQEWSGYAAFKNCLSLFVTLDKSNRPKYYDKFDGPLFYWDSKATSTESTPDIQLLIDGELPVILFARCLGSDEFVFCGQLKYLRSYSSRPVRFHWELVNYPQGVCGNAELDSLANWVPTAEKPANSKKKKNKVSKPPSYKNNIVEGAKRLVTGNSYERDPAARFECIDKLGCKCWVCGFDFAEKYGSMGDDFIFVHHRVPVPIRAKQGPYTIDPKRDLVPLCGNCHFIVHRKKAIFDEECRPGSLESSALDRLKELQSIASLDSWEENIE